MQAPGRKKQFTTPKKARANVTCDAGDSRLSLVRYVSSILCIQLETTADTRKVKNILPGPSDSGGSLASLAFGSKDQKWFQSVLSKFGFNGVLATVLSFFLYALYLKFVSHDEKGLQTLIKEKASQYLGKIPGLNKLSFLKGHLPLGKFSKSLIPKATKGALGSIAGSSGGILSKLNPFNWKIFNKRKIAEEEDDMRYQAGEPYGDPEVLAPTLRDDLKAVGLKAGVQDLKVLLDVVKNKGKPIDDRDLTVSRTRI
ncbi:unnamed protein product [Aspergillus oryzae]|nr:unnamed protein product [Aspergillus oryzae]GMF84816.1 unnamed protein product [Aspergillus oryzae]GMG03480.1 unnamed protein product [Aspergillus oryzae]